MSDEDLTNPDVLQKKLEEVDALLREKLAAMGMTPEEVESTIDPSGTPAERAARREKAIAAATAREIGRPELMQRFIEDLTRRIEEDPSFLERAMLSMEADELEQQLQRGTHIRRAVFAAVSLLLSLFGGLSVMFAIAKGAVTMIVTPLVIVGIGALGAFFLVHHGWPQEWVTRRANPVPKRIWLPVFGVALAVGVPLLLWPTGLLGKARSAWRSQWSDCRGLLTEKDVADLGGPKLVVESVSDGGNTCTLRAEPSKPGKARLSVAIRGDESDTYFKHNSELRLGGKLEPLPGVGDEAYTTKTKSGYGVAYRRGGASVTAFFPKDDFAEDVVERALPILQSRDGVIEEYLTDANRRGR